MPPQTVLRPEWVEEVASQNQGTPVKSKDVIRVKYEFEIDTDTVTFPEYRQHHWKPIPIFNELLKKHGVSETQRRKATCSTFDKLEDLAHSGWEEICKAVKQEFEEEHIVVELTARSITYHLNFPLKEHVSPVNEHEWEFSVGQFDSRFVGNGDSIALARFDFLEKIHIAFQSLVYLQPAQMDQKQSADWSLLEKLINVTAYRNSVPATSVETGIVSGITADGWQIKWIDNGLEEFIPNEQTSHQFVTLEVGKSFKALVARHLGTDQLLKLLYIESIEPLSITDNGEWTKEKNARRCELIDMQIQSTLSHNEQIELAQLQKQALDHFDHIAPPPMDGARKLHEQLLKKKQQQK